MKMEQYDLIVRCKGGVFLSDFMCKSDEEMKLISPDANATIHASLKLLIIAEKKRIFIHDYNQIINERQFNSISASYVSPQNQFIVVLDKTDQYQMHVVAIPNLQIIQTYTIKMFKRELWPYIKFSFDDKLYFIIENQILFCIDSNTIQVQYQVKVDKCEYFQVQPVLFPIITCYQVQEFDQKQATIKFINGEGKIIFDKKLPKTTDIEIIWSSDGQNLLIQKGCDEDATGQSYFGQNQVLQYDLQKNILKELPVYEGPVHSICWSPQNNEFILLSGFMPSGAVMYEKTGKPLFEFGKDHKNKIYWSPQQRYILICGFGNLDGSIDIWDSINKKHITKMKYKSASLCLWAPCGRKFLCAKVTPRLNVDNQYTIFDYHGQELLNRKFQTLYDVQFRPTDQKFEDRPPSPFQQQVQANDQPKKIVNFGVGFQLKPGPQIQQQNDYPPGYLPPPVKKEKKEKTDKEKEKDKKKKEKLKEKKKLQKEQEQKIQQ